MWTQPSRFSAAFSRQLCAAARRSSNQTGDAARVAAMFPGQGAQRAGMGADLLESFPYTKHVVDRIDHALGFFLSRRMTNPEESLIDTRITQPAMLLHSAMLLEILQTELDFVLSSSQGSPVVASLGHSVGEISALAAAGCMTHPQAAVLLAARGSAMANAVEASKYPTGMSALLPVQRAAVQKAAAEASLAASTQGQLGVAVAANLNSASQTVVSGHSHVIDMLVASLKSSSRLRAVPLSVSAPFHSPIMAPALHSIAKAIAPARELSKAPIPAHLLTAAFSHEAWFAVFQEQSRETVCLNDLSTFLCGHFNLKCDPEADRGDDDEPAFASLLQRGTVPVYSNVTALPHSFGGDDAPLAVALQAIAPVQWHRSMQHVLQGSDESAHEQPNVLLEIGPGSTLASLAKQISKEGGAHLDSQPIICNLDSAESIAELVRRAEKAPLGLADPAAWEMSKK